MTIEIAFSILSGLFALIRLLVEYMQRKEWIEEGYRLALFEGVKQANAAIEKAQAARARVRINLARSVDPMSDDGFRRDD